MSQRDDEETDAALVREGALGLTERNSDFMMDKTGTMPRRYAFILLTRMVCVAIVALFVAGIAGGVNVAHATTSGICNVKSFGAVGDGKHKDTTALQKAIDFCAASGINVELPPGTYLSAPLYLRTGLVLQIDKGATLDASQTLSDYTIPPGVTLHTKVLAFLNGYKISNVTIEGGGVINGEGAVWWATGRAADERPRLIELDYVTHANIGFVHLENAGSAHVYAFGSTEIFAQGMTVTAPSNSPNTDGIVFSNSQGILTECSIDTGGDNAAIVSGIGESNAPQLGSSNINVLGCQFKHGHGVSIGSGIAGGIKNIQVNGCTFNGTTNGIRIQSNRTIGGEVANVTYSGLTMINVAHPILFSAYSPKIPASDAPHPITATTPNYHDITVEDVVATGASDAGTIVGVPEKPLTGITFMAVTIAAQTGIVVRNATVTVIPGGTKITVSRGNAYILESKGKVLTVGSYEAESPANGLVGGAVVAACSACSGGQKVTKIGHGGELQLGVTVGIAGTYTITIYYVDGDAGRSAQLKIFNSDRETITTIAFHGTNDGNWNFVQSLTVSVPLDAFGDAISFSNGTASGPDIDRITVS